MRPAVCNQISNQISRWVTKLHILDEVRDESMLIENPTTLEVGADTGVAGKELGIRRAVAKCVIRCGAVLAQVVGHAGHEEQAPWAAGATRRPRSRFSIPQPPQRLSIITGVLDPIPH